MAMQAAPLPNRTCRPTRRPTRPTSEPLLSGRSEARNGSRLRPIEYDFHRHADADVGGVDVNHVRHHAWPLIQLDVGGDVRGAFLPRAAPLAHDCERIHGAAAGGLDPRNAGMVTDGAEAARVPDDVPA